MENTYLISVCMYNNFLAQCEIIKRAISGPQYFSTHEAMNVAFINQNITTTLGSSNDERDITPQYDADPVSSPRTCGCKADVAIMRREKPSSCVISSKEDLKIR